MNQRQIESFLAVAETGNFTRAAERLYISQPAVSKQVLSLEEELGFLLLIREYHKDVQLTEAGKLYYDFFHKVTEEYKAVYEQAQQYQQKIRGTLRLGILTGWKIQEKLQKVLEQMKQDYPEIEIRMSFADLEPLRKEAEAGKLDLIFTIRDSIKDAEYESRPQSDCVHGQVAKVDCECPFYWVKLAEMNRVLFYADDLFEKMQKQSANRTADSVKKAEGDIFVESGDEDNRTVQDFRKITFFTVADGEYDSAELVREYMRPYGFEPKVQLVPNIEEAVARTYSGMGAMIIDEWSREMKNTSLQHIVLNSCNEAVLAWKKENKNPAFACFLQEIKKLLEK